MNLYLPNEIVLAVLSYLPKDLNHEGSSAFGLYIFRWVVPVIELPPSLVSLIHLANGELLERINYNPRNRWPFFFSSDPSKLMWWGDRRPPAHRKTFVNASQSLKLATHTFTSTPYPPNLLALYNALSKFIPFLSHAPDCGPVVYRERVSLSWHKDLFGELIWNRKELVPLCFDGAPRDLLFKSANGAFHTRIECSSNICVVVTPLANDIFLHSKEKGHTPHLSTTFAFRNGATPNEIM